jgi:hypothetical protein
MDMLEAVHLLSAMFVEVPNIVRRRLLLLLSCPVIH